jgi:hypothetical protein
MGGLSGDAVDHLVPVVQIIVGVIVLLAALIGGLWRGFVWLDKRIGARIAGWADSKDFKQAVADIVSQASAGWSDLYNRQLEDVRHGIKDLRERDLERADSVKRAHQRIDAMMERK